MNLLARRPPLSLLVLADTVVAVLLARVSTTDAPGLNVSTAAALACWLPVAVRRIRPVPAYCGALLACLLAPALQVNQPLMIVAVALAVYPVAVTQPARRSAIALVAGLLVTGGALLVSALGAPGRTNGWPDPVFIVGMTCLVVGASWSLGTAARTRREFAAREARRQAEKAVADERLRISRELHDVVAHSMSMITVKAGVAAKVLDKHPEEGRKALRAIEEIGRGSLVEMRQLLGALRAPGGAPEHTPLPGLVDLPSLAHRAAEAGVQVDLSVSGDVPGSMELSVYRIVQEAITNVVRHAAPARCRASVSVVDGLLSISVTDDGPGRRVLPGETGGHGLAGMRERAMMYGGAFEAGPLPGSGFGVRASWEIP
ncbi:two-component sensor histidine kinase [Microtetraspora sp. NBRC 13810]|uniref:sensor histidine kinase n=1 Tax=Microtetraspora sp. NBRC 13810 TaxID=3030990 RepID=UPI0024A5823E|nr:sensor histidine kinase [Microtetraspora sp. NBRC 13810]GLW12429.1 two-component sensor histidine kinase [Microtetraspora sp. NBRC 13810]